MYLSDLHHSDLSFCAHSGSRHLVITRPLARLLVHLLAPTNQLLAPNCSLGSCVVLLAIESLVPQFQTFLNYGVKIFRCRDQKSKRHYQKSSPFQSKSFSPLMNLQRKWYKRIIQEPFFSKTNSDLIRETTTRNELLKVEVWFPYRFCSRTKKGNYSQFLFVMISFLTL